MPKGANAQEFFRRVCNGYKLNQIGMSTNSIISTFNLEKEVAQIFKNKSQYGQHAHSDRCRIGGKTINEWLSAPDSMPEFIQLMIDSGWIKKNEPPEQSRFWKLIEGEGDQAKMFGVFSGYEKQVIYDWIAGDSQKAMPNNVTRLPQTNNRKPIPNMQMDNPRLDSDVVELEAKLVSVNSIQEIIKLLTPYLSPALHHTPAGLMATRLYKSMMYKAPAAYHHLDSVYTST
jgi:hypothetical protein